MLTRFRAFIPEWTCGKTSDESDPGKIFAHAQSAGLCSLPWTAERAYLEGLSRTAGSQSCGRDHTLDREVDSHLSASDSLCNTIAALAANALAGALSPDAG